MAGSKDRKNGKQKEKEIEKEEVNQRPNPFKAEYAKSGKSTCKFCGKVIAKDALRIAKVVESKRFEGYMPLWHHFDCIYEQSGLISSLEEIDGLDSLKDEDKESIKKYVEEKGKKEEKEGEEGKKREEKSMEELEQEREKEIKSHYFIEYAKSHRSTCKKCDKKIEKNEVRIGKSGIRGGFHASHWFHSHCFFELKEIENAFLLLKINGWDSISSPDQKRLIAEYEGYMKSEVEKEMKEQHGEEIEKEEKGEEKGEEKEEGERAESGEKEEEEKEHEKEGEGEKEEEGMKVKEGEEVEGKENSKKEERKVIREIQIEDKDEMNREEKMEDREKENEEEMVDKKEKDEGIEIQLGEEKEKKENKEEIGSEEKKEEKKEEKPKEEKEEAKNMEVEKAEEQDVKHSLNGNDNLVMDKAKEGDEQVEKGEKDNNDLNEENEVLNTNDSNVKKTKKKGKENEKEAIKRDTRAKRGGPYLMEEKKRKRERV